MKIDIFCGWPEISDVGINLSRTEEEAKAWKDPHLHFFVDLTIDEAEALAYEILSKVEAARSLRKDFERYYEKNE